MKKFFDSLFIAIAAMVVFAGCAKQEINEPATSETKTVQFLAESIETKTAFGTPEDGTYPTLWSTSDAVKILVNLEQVKDTEKKVYVMCSDDLKSARFTAELVTPEADNFTFYSISPADAFLGKSSGKGCLYVTIPAEQTPLTTSVDMAAQLLYASSETTETMPTSVELTYHHLTAYGKLSLTNLTPNVSSVSEIKLEAPEDVYIAGNWDYYVADGSFAVRSGKGSNSIVLSTTNTNDIWFACAPVDMSGKKMTLTVTTDKGDLKKEITFPENRKFKAGRISKFTVDMAGVEVDTPEDPEVVSAYYEKVTSDLADWSGTYLMVCTSKSMALSGISTTSTKYGIGSEVTIEDNKIAATDELASSQIVISPSSSTKDAYLLAFNGGYLSWTSGNSLNVSDEDNTNSNWKITVSDDANVSISNCKDDTRKIVWNASSPRFACYTTAQTAIQLYKLAESEGGETPEPKPKTLVSIKVENPKIEYTAGEEFVAPNVTATYDDESTATVIGATFTGYDMATAGTYTVTVSYTEGEVTATTTFDITVSTPEILVEDGAYVIAVQEEGVYYAASIDANGDRRDYVELTGYSSGEYVSHDSKIVWTITNSVAGITVSADDKYWGAIKNGVSLVPSSSASIISVAKSEKEGAYLLYANCGDDGTRYLSKNANYGFGFYAESNKEDIYLIPAKFVELPTLDAPVVTAELNATKDGINVTWESVTDAQKYVVICGETKVEVTDTNYEFKGLNSGTYSITVTALAENYNSATSKTVTVTVPAAEGEPKTATIEFGKSAIVINDASVTGKDSQNNEWTITTVGTDSFTSNADYYQVGSAKSPATSIVFTTTLPDAASVSSVVASFGGFNGTKGTVTLKVGDATVGTGALNATTDVEVKSSSTASGNIVTVTVTDIAKGVKCYKISVTYTE